MKDTHCNVSADESGKQLENQGNLNYPVAFYSVDLKENTINWHWHEEFELIFSANSTIKVIIGQNEIQIEKGNGCFINSGILHSVCGSETDESLLHSIVFHPKLIGAMESIYWQKYVEPIMNDKTRKFVELDHSKKDDNEILRLIEMAFDCEFAETFGYELEVRAALSKAILMLTKDKTGKRYIPTNQQLRDMERVKLMIAFIENSFAENLTVYDIAKAASLSESECLRCFKRSTGFTPNQFLRDFRLQKAAEFIRLTRTKISDIAMQCGFNDISYFSESFKQKMGEVPKNYRKNLTKSHFDEIKMPHKVS